MKKCRLYFILVLSLAVIIYDLHLFWLTVPQTEAATAGKMVLYMHKEPSDKNETLNALTLTPPEAAADTASLLTSTTNVNATPPTALCESTNNTGETFNKVSAASATTGNRCMASFISMPVGQAITIAALEASAVSANIWSMKSSSSVVAIPNIYIYKWDGTTLTRIKTFTGVNTGTVVTQSNFAFAATDNASIVSLAATDRIVAIVSMNVTTAVASSNVSVLFDSSARAASQVTLKYTIISPNKPTLSGPQDDDFTVAAGTTACSTAGVAYNTKWTCLQGTATNSAGDFNAEDALAAGAGDSSQWLWLRNRFSAAGTASNFGTTPSNTFLYQATTSGYGNGVIQTVVHSPLPYTVGASNPATPFSHSGIVLWSSNTDYYEVQVYSDAAKGALNTAKVALVKNVSGTVTFVATANINSTVSNGFYNRVWLGFSNTAGNYQAQYSTDGTTWVNLGAAQAHANFARMGLNVFTGIGAIANANAAGFAWFRHTFIGGLPATGTLTSVALDTGVTTGAAFNSITWKGTFNAGTGKVRFQLATSNVSTGPFNFVGGATCAVSDWYDGGSPNTPTELTCAPVSHNNQRYYEYKVQICSASDCTSIGTISPQVTDVIVNWSP